MNEFLTKNDGIDEILVNVLAALKYLKQNIDTIDENLLRGILSNIQGTVITIDTIIMIMKESKKYSVDDILRINEEIKLDNKQPMVYEEMESYGLLYNHNTPLKSLQEEIKFYTAKLRLKKSGLIKLVKGYDINPTKFAKYTFSRVNMVKTTHEDFYVYSEDGFYKPMNQDDVCQIIFHLMNDISDDVWRTKLEAQAFRAIQLSCTKVQAMDSNKDIINLNNGILDLQTFELKPHSPSYLSSIRIDIDYRKEAECSRFKLYMKQITNGDEQLEMLLQEIMGYCLTGETRAEKAFIFYGAGSNGKSVFAKILTMIAGYDNVTNIPLREFGTKFGTETIVGKTINIATETELDDSRLNTENIKSIASGDQMHIQRKYKKGIDIVPLIKLIFLTNNLPRVNDTTKGFLRKIMIIPFNAEFTHNNEDPNKRLDNRLIDKLKDEKEGILQYALEGLKRLRENKFQFTRCNIVDNALVNYEKEINPTIEFFEDNIDISHGSHTHRPDIFKRFKEWASETGKFEWSNMSTQLFWKMFEQTMSNNGLKYETKKISGHHKVLNIKLKQDLNENDFDDLVFNF